MKTLRISKDEIINLLEKQYKITNISFKGDSKEVFFDFIEGEFASKKSEKKKKEKQEKKD